MGIGFDFSTTRPRSPDPMVTARIAQHVATPQRPGRRVGFDFPRPVRGRPARPTIRARDSVGFDFSGARRPTCAAGGLATSPAGPIEVMPPLGFDFPRATPGRSASPGSGHGSRLGSFFPGAAGEGRGARLARVGFVFPGDRRGNFRPGPNQARPEIEGWGGFRRARRSVMVGDPLDGRPPASARSPAQDATRSTDDGEVGRHRRWNPCFWSARGARPGSGPRTPPGPASPRARAAARRWPPPSTGPCASTRPRARRTTSGPPTPPPGGAPA